MEQIKTITNFPYHYNCDVRVTRDIALQYNEYKRIRDEWESLGNKKMVNYLNKRMQEIRTESFILAGIL